MSGTRKRKLGDWNMVPGCPGWYYGLLVRQEDGSVRFSVQQLDSGAEITDLHASSYRTTTLARRMGIRDLHGYQHVAVQAIRARR